MTVLDLRDEFPRLPFRAEREDWGRGWYVVIDSFGELRSAAYRATRAEAETAACVRMRQMIHEYMEGER